ncbi:hypothetical protein D3C72_2395890 [compost metagenome]
MIRCGLLRAASARRCTAEGMVAEKSMVWRACGMRSTRASSSVSKPLARISSASSSTRV